MTTPNQQYVLVQNPKSGGPSRTQGTGGQGQASGSGGSRTGSASRQQQARVPLPAGVPAFLGDQKILFGAWVASMILVGFDEWHNYRMLPRPSRFWYTSLTFGLLMIAGQINALVPLVNALGIGFTIMLLWQYYNGSGQFSRTSGSAA